MKSFSKKPHPPLSSHDLTTRQTARKKKEVLPTWGLHYNPETGQIYGEDRGEGYVEERERVKRLRIAKGLIACAVVDGKDGTATSQIKVLRNRCDELATSSFRKWNTAVLKLIRVLRKHGYMPDNSSFDAAQVIMDVFSASAADKRRGIRGKGVASRSSASVSHICKFSIPCVDNSKCLCRTKRGTIPEFNFVSEADLDAYFDEGVKEILSWKK